MVIIIITMMKILMATRSEMAHVNPVQCEMCTPAGTPSDELGSSLGWPSSIEPLPETPVRVQAQQQQPTGHCARNSSRRAASGRSDE